MDAAVTAADSTRDLGDLKDLRDKTERNYVKKSLKKALFGGFEEQSVLRFIRELGDREKQARVMLNQRLEEVNGELSLLRQQHEETEKRLEEALASKTEQEQLFAVAAERNEALERQLDDAAETISAFEEKQREYDSQIRRMTVSFEAYQSAAQVKKQYDQLETEYTAVTAAKEEAERKNAALLEKLEELQERDMILSRESAATGGLYEKTLANFRVGKLQAGADFGTFEAKQAALAARLLAQAGESLDELKRLQALAEAYGVAFRRDMALFTPPERPSDECVTIGETPDDRSTAASIDTDAVSSVEKHEDAAE